MGEGGVECVDVKMGATVVGHSLYTRFGTLFEEYTGAISI